MKETNSNNLELASMKARIQAFVIDDVLITFLIVALFWEMFTDSNANIEEVMLVMNDFVYQVIFIKFIYHTFFVWYYGATLGKQFAKIKVIDNDTLGNITLLNAAFRSFARVISEMFFYIGFVLGFFNDGKRTFHDFMARSVVVNA
ncbi:MAG: RDD family protein [Campylobacteraceae bacterium]|nr:RDD family protein [Campylobacteraceae bacterium]